MKKRNLFKSFFDEFFKDDFFSSQYTSSFKIYGDASDSLSFSYPTDDDKNFNKTEEISETDTHTIKKEVWTSINGSSNVYERITKMSKQKPKEMDKQTMESLKIKLDEALKVQNYEKACEIRDEMKKLV